MITESHLRAVVARLLNMEKKNAKETIKAELNVQCYVLFRTKR